MAEDVIGGLLNFNYLGLASTLLWAIIVIGIVGLVLYYVWFSSKFNKVVYVRDEVSGGNVVRVRKAREYMDKDKNILMWDIRGEAKVPCPPKEAIATTPKGKKICEIVRVQGDQYHWLNISSFKQDAMAQSGKYFVISEDAKRQFADQIQKAERERSTKLNQLLQQLAPILLFVVLIIGSYFIFDTVSTNMNEISKNVAGVTAPLAEVSRENREMIELAKDIIQERERQKLVANNATTVPN